MNWFDTLLYGRSVAHSLLILSLVIAFGLALGSIKVRGIKLGVAGVLFSGLLFGHLKLGIEPAMLEFARELGLIFFVYTIGMQVGPGFISSLRRQGLPLNLMAAGVVFLGAIITVIIAKVGCIDIPAVLGMYSGAVTNTPSLAAAQQALKDIPGLAESALKQPGLGYAVAYPFGIMGIILTMLLAKSVFRVDLPHETDELHVQEESTVPHLVLMNLEVQNPNLVGLTYREIPMLGESGIVISRMLHDGQPVLPTPDTRLDYGDILLAVGDRAKLDQFRILVGRETSVDPSQVPGPITTRRLIITQKSVIGKSVQEMQVRKQFGVTITRVSRADIDFPPTPHVRLQYGDTILAVGSAEGIAKVEALVGNSAKMLNHPELVSIFIGIALGVLLGNIPFSLPFLTEPVKLGLAGGPLIVAIILSRLGRCGPLVWYMPISGNFMLREVGIALFLAAVGLRSGDQFIATLVEGQGFTWMALAAVITIVPLLTVALVGRLVMKTNYLTLCGLLAGSCTDPPALAFATAHTGSDAPSVAYSTVYPLTMILRVLSAQMLVMLLMR